MKNLANFVLFQAGWFACVGAAAEGHMWIGPLATLAIVTLHLLFIVDPTKRRWELRYILLVGLVGLLADTGLGALGATDYPTSEAVWSSVLHRRGLPRCGSSSAHCHITHLAGSRAGSGWL